MSELTFTEAKTLVSLWSTGTFPTIAESIRYHFARHGESLSAKNVWQYLRKAGNFSNNLRNARKSSLENGKIRDMKNGFFVIINLQGKIVSFGIETEQYVE
jgi:hypothetical protein